MLLIVNIFKNIDICVVFENQILFGNKSFFQNQNVFFEKKFVYFKKIQWITINKTIMWTWKRTILTKKYENKVWKSPCFTFNNFCELQICKNGKNIFCCFLMLSGHVSRQLPNMRPFEGWKVKQKRSLA